MHILLVHSPGSLTSRCLSGILPLHKLLQARRMFNRFVSKPEPNCIHQRIYFDNLDTLNKLFSQRMKIEIATKYFDLSGYFISCLKNIFSLFVQSFEYLIQNMINFGKQVQINQDSLYIFHSDI